MAEFIQNSLSKESASRWSVTTSPPLRPKPSLAAPVSIRIKRKANTGDVQPPNPPVEDDRTAIVLEFVQLRDQEYPLLAKDYFSNHLRRRVDFHNVFAITASGRRVEELEKVVVSVKLNIRMAAALSTFGRRTWGDVSEGFSSQSVDRPATPEAPFKARLFLHRRYSDAWSMASDDVISCPNTPDESETVADEDEAETLVAHEDEQQEEHDDEEWETISKKDAHEACSEKEDALASKSTETEADELLPKAIRDAVNRMSPAFFPFDIAWYILKPYMPFQGRLAAATQYARVLISRGGYSYDLFHKKLNKVARTRRRSKTVPVRAYKLLSSSRAPRRSFSLGFIGSSVSLAAAGARWIMYQVKKMLRRVGRMMLRQDIR